MLQLRPCIQFEHLGSPPRVPPAIASILTASPRGINTNFSAEEVRAVKKWAKKIQYRLRRRGTKVKKWEKENKGRKHHKNQRYSPTGCGCLYSDDEPYCPGGLANLNYLWPRSFAWK